MGRCYEFAAVITEGCDHAMRVSAAGGACECPTCGARCPGQFAACAAIVQKPGYVPASAPEWAVRCTDPPRTESPRAERGATTSSRGGHATPTSPARVAVVQTPDEIVAMVRTELAVTTNALRTIVTHALEQARDGDRDSAALSASVADAMEHVQSRLADGLTAQIVQALRPVMQHHQAELLQTVDAVRRDLSDRIKELSGAQDRLHLLYQELATAFADENETANAVVEGLARVARRVGGVERSLGITPPQ